MGATVADNGVDGDGIFGVAAVRGQGRAEATGTRRFCAMNEPTKLCKKQGTYMSNSQTLFSNYLSQAEDRANLTKHGGVRVDMGTCLDLACCAALD